jgi:nitrogen fixation/metabolism regulation signal transduction histidine kinase
MAASPQRPPRLALQDRIAWLAVAGALPGALTALAILWTGDYTAKVQWTLTSVIVVTLAASVAAIRERVTVPLQTFSNLLAALREGDFSIRARAGRPDEPLTDVIREVNTLAETLHEERLDALEATALLRTVMAEIDVAVFTFDADHRLQLVNRAGQRLLGQPAERLLLRNAEELDLARCCLAEPGSTRAMTFPGGSGRYEIRLQSFRQHGAPHQLLVLTDVSRPLREEERRAWQRLIRVLGHELNNSLTPITSIAGSLEAILSRPALPDDWDADLRRGLQIIRSRAEALGRFMTAYARLARLPPPSTRPVDLGALLARAARLEQRLPVTLIEGPATMLELDPDQVEQALINLLRNAADAALETHGAVRAGWDRPRRGAGVAIWIEDEGPGVSNPANLFVPFFTTKPGGSGIGLALSRQIAEAHGGSLTLENRRGGPGCRAVLSLPGGGSE